MLGDLVDGKYQVQRLLSRGGNGTVYVARHVHLGTEVALKVLDATADHPDERRRLLREARVAARLSHANLVPILDCGIIGDRAYVVMEFVTGGDLRSYLTRHAPLGLAATCGVIRDIAAGLTAAHDAGVVHRDLKPENVVLDARTSPPRAWSTSAATLARPRPRVSQSTTPAMAGTPAYLAPEQASGAGPVTDAVDRWALGVIAYECLSGRPPFAAESLGELVLQICAWPLPTPSTAAAVPVGFDAWFARACAREPAARFPSVAAMAAALAALDRAHTAPAALAPTSRPRRRRAWRSRRRRRWLAVAAGIAASRRSPAWSRSHRRPLAPPATAVPVDAPQGPTAPAPLRLAVLLLKVIAPVPDDTTPRR
jgi:serine/threonine-protein kinase